VIDDLSNGVNVIRIRPIDDSVGAGLNLASYIDEAVRLGFRSGYLDRKRHVKSLKFTSESTGQRFNPVRRFVADTEGNEKSVDVGFERLWIQPCAITKITGIRIRIQCNDQVSRYPIRCCLDELGDRLRSPCYPVVETARFESTFTSITATELGPWKPRSSESLTSPTFPIVSIRLRRFSR